MDQTPLIERDIEAGRRLVEMLDAEGFPLVAAFWKLLPEEGEWRLVLASPRVREVGRLASYAALRGILTRSPIEHLSHRISVVEPEEHPVSDLRTFVGTDPAPYIGDQTLDRTVIGDVFVHGAYVYRAERIIGRTGVFDLWSVGLDQSRKVWIARRCSISLVRGDIQSIDVEGVPPAWKTGKYGINARLDILINVRKQDERTVGDVLRWTIESGRLFHSRMVARGVNVEGYQEAPSVPATV